MNGDNVYQKVKNILDLTADDNAINPSQCVIQLLAPYISILFEHFKNSDVENKQKKKITTVIKIILLSTSETQKPDLIDELGHLVAHYAIKNKSENNNSVTKVPSKFGATIADCVFSGLIDAFKEKQNSNRRYVNFNDISSIRQTYWNRLTYRNPDTHRMHRTIRINGMPFAEGVLVYLMAHFAHEYGIKLEIIDVPWKDVGVALLTNHIDIAFYNESITKQLEGLHRLADNRLLFRTEKTFTYQKYYFLSLKDKSRPPKPEDNTEIPKIAIVSNSDYEKVFSEWCNFHHNFDKSPVLPVASPDEALQMVVDGKADYCVAGGIHKHYAESVFGNYIQISAIDNVTSTDVFFWAISSRIDQSKKLLTDMISLWEQMISQWTTVEYGLDNSIRSHCITYVNRQPNKAFINSNKYNNNHEKLFEILAQLIEEHDKLCSLDITKINPITIAGW